MTRTPAEAIRWRYAVLAALVLVGCRSRTELGQCIGAFDDPPDSTLVYKASARNIFVGVIFAELIYPPIKVIVDQTRCPVRRKGQDP